MPVLWRELGRSPGRHSAGSQVLLRRAQVHMPLLRVVLPGGHCTYRVSRNANQTTAKTRTTMRVMTSSVFRLFGRSLAPDALACSSDRKSTRLNSSHLGISYA